MKKKFSIIFILVLFLLQAKLMIPDDANFAFLLGVQIAGNTKMVSDELMYWLLPIIALTFYFSGFIRDSLSKYGFLYIIRGISRIRWWIQKIVVAICTVIIFILLQLLIFYMMTDTTIDTTSTEFIGLVIQYFLMLMTLIFIQLTCELFIESNVAHLIITLYIVSSVLIAHIIYPFVPSNQYFWLFLPLNGMGANTGVAMLNSISALISTQVAISVLFISMVAVFILSIVKVKKIDIF